MECHLFYANRRKIRSAGYANHANLRKSVTKHNTRENLNQQVNRDVFASSRSPLKYDHNHHTTLIMLHNFAPPKCHDCDRRSCLSANGGSAWLTSIVSPFSLSSTLLVCFEQFRLFLCFYISLIPIDLGARLVVCARSDDLSQCQCYKRAIRFVELPVPLRRDYSILVAFRVYEC